MDNETRNHAPNGISNACCTFLVTAILLLAILLTPSVPLIRTSRTLASTHHRVPVTSAIDILRTDHGPICRVYNACLTKSGQLLLPQWMSVHQRVLANCGLSPTFQEMRHRVTGDFDWLGPGLTGRDLRTVSDGLFRMYSQIIADHGSHVDRTCISPPGRLSTVCSESAARPLSPAILIGKDDLGDDELLAVLRDGVWSGYTANITVISSMRTHQPTCFRSVITGSRDGSSSRNESGNPARSGVSGNETAVAAGELTDPVDDIIANWKGAEGSHHWNGSVGGMRGNGSDVLGTEGGVELFTHRGDANGRRNNSTTDLHTWNEVTSVCRIHRVCRLSEGGLLFPLWMKRYEAEVRHHCDVGKVKYVANKGFDNALRNVSALSSSSPSGEYDGLQVDLIGNSVYRKHERELMANLFQSAIDGRAVLYDRRKFTRRCMYRAHSGAGTTASSHRSCKEDRDGRFPLNAAFLLQATDRWTTAVQRIERSSHPNNPSVRRALGISHNGPQDAACFRSIVLPASSS